MSDYAKIRQLADDMDAEYSISDVYDGEYDSAFRTALAQLLSDHDAFAAVYARAERAEASLAVITSMILDFQASQENYSHVDIDVWCKEMLAYLARPHDERTEGT